MFTTPIASNGFQFPLVGTLGFIANRINPAGRARRVPSNKEGQLVKLYWVTAYVVPQKNAGIMASKIFIYLYAKISCRESIAKNRACKVSLR